MKKHICTRATGAVSLILTLAMVLSAVPALGATAAYVGARPSAATRPSGPERAEPGGVRVLAADDEIPGIPIPPSPFTTTVNATTDIDDVYAVHLNAGEALSVSITGPANTYFDVYLYDVGSTSILDEADIVAFSDAEVRNFVNPYTLDFRADTSQGYVAGDYYLDVYAASGAGSYTINWRKVPADNNNDIPGEVIPASPFTGWASSYWLLPRPGNAVGGTLVDGFDVYAIALAEGEQLKASVSTTDSNLTMEMLLYPPHASHVDTDGVVVYGDAFVASSYFASAAMPDGFSFVVPPGGAGTYYLSAEAWGGSGDYKIAWSVNSDKMVRLSGPNRYATGQAIVRSTAVSATTAILASGAGYADALSAAGVAGAYGAPLILTDPKALVDVVSVQLVEMGVTDVIIVGGTAAVSAAVSTALVDSGFNVERLWGIDRYATSAACANRVASVAGTSTAFVVRGDGFADALAVAPFAYSQKVPVLLTRPTALPSEIAAFLDTNNIADVYIAGGTPAVSSGVMTAIDRLNELSTTVTRLSGVDRYRTARAVADFGVSKGWGAYGFVGVATGTNFPDALAGGVACGRMGGVLLLTNPTTLSPSCAGAISANAGTITRIAVLGSTSAVSSGVYTAISNLLP